MSRYRITIERIDDGAYLYRDYLADWFLNHDAEYIGTNIVDMFDTLDNSSTDAFLPPPGPNEPPL